MAIDQVTLAGERTSPGLFPLPAGSQEAFAHDRTTCFGWREDADGEGSYLLQHYGWSGRWRVAESWPATADGWDDAWRYLSTELPELARAVSAAVDVSENPQAAEATEGDAFSGAGFSAQTWPPAWLTSMWRMPGFQSTFQTLVWTRLLVWIVSLLGLWLIGSPDQPTPFTLGSFTNLFAVSARWDSLWYLQIAQHGYATAQSTNFYPLFPLLIHVFTWVFRAPVLAGLAVSWTCALIAGVLLFKLVALDYGEVIARRAVLLLYLSPMAVFLTAVYTESLFLTLSIGCLYAARREKWWVAGGLAALASATRPPGILLALPLALLFFYGPRQIAQAPAGSALARLRDTAGRAKNLVPRYGWSASATAIALTGGGLLVYLTYCALHVQDFFEPFHVQQVDWTHYDTFPFGALWHATVQLPSTISDVIHGTGGRLSTVDPISWNAHELIDFAFVIPVAVLLVQGWRSIPFAYTAYVLVNVMLVLSTPTHFELLQSFDRYTLVLFPLLITVARRWMANPIPRLVTLGTSTAALCFFAAWFGAGKWVA